MTAPVARLGMRARNFGLCGVVSCPEEEAGSAPKQAAFVDCPNGGVHNGNTVVISTQEVVNDDGQVWDEGLVIADFPPQEVDLLVELPVLASREQMKVAVSHLS